MENSIAMVSRQVAKSNTGYGGGRLAWISNGGHGTDHWANGQNEENLKYKFGFNKTKCHYQEGKWGW